jgi:HlyD family secretion protein
MRILNLFSLIIKLIILLVAFAFFSCHQKKDSIKPELSKITESVYASGVVLSKNQYTVYSQASGIVNQVYVDEGVLVDQGTAILSLVNDNQLLSKNNAELSAKFNDYEVNKAKLVEAKSFVESALSQLKLDSALLARQRRLWEQNIGTKLSLEQREIAFTNSKANYLSKIEKLGSMERQLSYQSKQAKNNLKISEKLTEEYVVKSELKGKVYQINVRKGEMVTPQMPVAILGEQDQFLLEMQIDENDIVLIHEGLLVKVVLNSYKDTVFNALVTKINPIMNVQSKTFTVEAEFTKPPSSLYPNISFEANVVISTKEKAMLIPRKYLHNDTMVVLTSGERVKVTTGLKDYQNVEILSGIGIDDELILP